MVVEHIFLENEKVVEMEKWKVVIRNRNFGWRASVHRSRHELHGSRVPWRSGGNGHGSREDRTFMAPGLVRREVVEFTGRSETTLRAQVLGECKEASRGCNIWE